MTITVKARTAALVLALFCLLAGLALGQLTQAHSATTINDDSPVPLGLFKLESRWINYQLRGMGKGMQRLGLYMVATREVERTIHKEQTQFSKQLDSIAGDSHKACEAVTSGCP